MFDKDKYLTCGVNANIPLSAQLFMWEMIETARAKIKLDYLQIFRLKPAHLDSGAVQVVEHSQEQPPFRQTAALPCDNPITAKVWAIDDGDYSTMLLPEER